MIESTESIRILKEIVPTLLGLRTFYGLRIFLKKNGLKLKEEVEKQSEVAEVLSKIHKIKWSLLVKEEYETVQGKRRSRHIKGLDFNDVPLITEDELKVWEESYVKRIAERW